MLQLFLTWALPSLTLVQVHLLHERMFYKSDHRQCDILADLYIVCVGISIVMV